jgi:hypothetical protein
MVQDSGVMKEHQEQFVKSICETNVVFGLENDEGSASSSSEEYEDESGVPIELICFWSDAARATSCTAEAWKGYRLVEIPLGEFIENWCVGMSNEGLLVGINFGDDLSGAEMEPLDLIVEVAKELKSRNKEITLANYGKLDDLVTEIRNLETPE